MSRRRKISRYRVVINKSAKADMLGPGVAKRLTEMMIKGRPLLEPGVSDALRADRDFYKNKREVLE